MQNQGRLFTIGSPRRKPQIRSRSDSAAPSGIPITRSSPESAVIRLFVYGTLRENGYAAELLEGCSLEGSASVAGNLYDVGSGFPALVLSGGGKVWGEVWRCPGSVFAHLDAYEGVERGLFQRVSVMIEGTECWTYVAGPALVPLLAPDHLIPSGDWLTH